MTVGQKIVKARKRLGWYRTDLANATGINYHSIRHYETDEAEPPLSYAVKIADALGLTLDYLARCGK